ncbi:MAG: ATPase [Saprospiraceae bacterium]|nr:MAG: ATPase [Saprospiraceae bacterium]
MIVIADSGSTKADWAVMHQDETRNLSTMGFNPVFHNSDQIYGELDKAFINTQERAMVEGVFYYGSGCWDQKRKAVIKQALNRIFNNARIEVQHDLLGAARASCGNDPGISCIMGTGSNSCLYDGVDVIDNVTNLGYMLGDEGSGTFLGKMLIQTYFYREMPKEMAPAFEAFIGGGKSTILDKVYGKETPNVYLASLTKFMAETIDHPFIQRLLYKGFATFIDRHVRKYKGHLGLPIHFIGSIAYHFQDVLRLVLEERSMTAGQFIQKPIDELVKYHSTVLN